MFATLDWRRVTMRLLWNDGNLAEGVCEPVLGTVTEH